MSNRGESLRLAAIVFTDIVGYSGVINRDAVLGAKLLDRQRSVVRKCLPLYSGREVETAGDSFLLEFPSALKALECVADIQRRLAKANQPFSESERVQLRASIHLGDVEHRAKEVFGDGVNVAARILPLSPEGGVAYSETVHQQVRNRIQVTAKSIGAPPLKNIAYPIEVFTLDAASATGIEPTTMPKIEVPAPARSRTIWIPIAGLAGCLVTAAALLWLQHAREIPPLPPGTIPAVAVLPFENLGAKPDDDYLVNGVHRQVIENLARVRALKVIGPSSVQGFAGRPHDIRSIAKDLAVRTIVEGTLERTADRVIVHINLTDLTSGERRWSQVYDKELRDLAALQGQLALDITHQTSAALSPEENAFVEEIPTVNPQAYQLWLRADQLIRTHAGDVKTMKECVELERQAVQLDPTFIRAYHAWFVDLVDLGHWEPMSPSKSEEMHNLLRTMERLDPRSPWTRRVRAIYYFTILHDYVRGTEEFRAVAGLMPGRAAAHADLGAAYSHDDRLPEAILADLKAVELDPKRWSTLNNLAGHYLMSHQYAEAISAAERALEINPEDHGVQTARALAAFAASGDLEGFLAASRRLLGAQDLPKGAVLSRRLDLAQLGGQFAELLEYLRKSPEALVKAENSFGPVPRDFYVANAERLRGKEDTARRAFRDGLAVAERSIKHEDADPLLYAWQAVARASLGDKVGALAAITATRATVEFNDPEVRSDLLPLIAQAYVLLDDKDEAINILETLINRGSMTSPAYLRHDETWSSLRNHPRFRMLVGESDAT